MMTTFGPFHKEKFDDQGDDWISRENGQTLFLCNEIGRFFNIPDDAKHIWLEVSDSMFYGAQLFEILDDECEVKIQKIRTKIDEMWLNVAFFYNIWKGYVRVSYA